MKCQYLNKFKPTTAPVLIIPAVENYLAPDPCSNWDDMVEQTNQEFVRATYAPAGFCNCYVSKLPPETQFSLRYGAHALDCPVYRVSRDPVDNADDCVFRETAEQKVLS